MSFEDYDNARQIVVTMRSGEVHTFPNDPRQSAWANAVVDQGWLVVYTEGRTEAFVIGKVEHWKRIG